MCSSPVDTREKEREKEEDPKTLAEERRRESSRPFSTTGVPSRSQPIGDISERPFLLPYMYTPAGIRAASKKVVCETGYKKFYIVPQMSLIR